MTSIAIQVGAKYIKKQFNASQNRWIETTVEVTAYKKVIGGYNKVVYRDLSYRFGTVKTVKTVASKVFQSTVVRKID